MLLPLLAVICFVLAFVLKLVGSALGSFDYVIFVIVGLGFMAAHMVHPISIRR